MKSCLKTAPNTPPTSPSPPPTNSLNRPRPPCLKHVSFCAQGEEEVFPADDWDRTPSAACRKLSYEEILELKSIQRSLPHAEQTPDSLSYLPRFLKQVPIHLLPLLPDSPPTRSTVPASLSSPPPESPLPPQSVVAPPAAAHHPPSPPCTPPPETKPASTTPVVSPSTPSPPFFGFAGKTTTTTPTPPTAAPRRKLAMAFLPLLPTSDTPTPPPRVEEPAEGPCSEEPPSPESERRASPLSAPTPVLSSSPAKPSDDAQPSPHAQLLTPSGTPAMGTLPLEDSSADGAHGAGPAILASPGGPTPAETATPPSADATSSVQPAEMNKVDAAGQGRSKQLPTPGSTPALTPCTLASETEAAPAEARAPEPARRSPRRAGPQLLDSFPAPPTDLPTGAPQSTAETPTSPPSLSDVLAVRLGSLATAATPSPPESAEASPSVGPHCASASAAAAVLSQSYFYLPVARPRTTAAPLSLRSPIHHEPSLGSGGALPESPFIDPMMGYQQQQRAVPPMRGATDERSWRPAQGGGGPFALALPPVPPQGPSAAALRSLRLEALPSPALVPPSPLLLSSVGDASRVAGSEVAVSGGILPPGVGTVRRAPLVSPAGVSSPLAQHD